MAVGMRQPIRRTLAILLAVSVVIAIWSDEVSGLTLAVLLLPLSICVHCGIAFFVLKEKSCSQHATQGERLQEYLMWFDLFYAGMARFRLPYIPATLCLMAALYLSGLGMAYLYDFQKIYVTSYPVYLGVIGTGWVTAVLRWAKHHLIQELTSIRSCFIIEDSEYYQLIELWIQRFTNPRYVYLSVTCMMSFTVLMAYVSVYYGPRLETFGIQSIRPTPFPPEWYEGNLGWKAATMSFYAIVCSIPLATSVYLLVVNLAFLFHIRHLRPIPLPQLLVVKLRGITRVYLVVTFAWYIGGVSLFALLLIGQLDPFSVSVLLGLGLIGFSAFFWPQLLFHHFVVVAYNDLSDGIAILYRNVFGTRTFVTAAQEIVNPDDLRQKESIQELTELVDLLSPGQLWVFDFKDVSVLLLGQGLALAAVLVRSYLG